MTRIAVVAASEELRTRITAALSSDPAFDVVAVGATPADVASRADVVLVAHEADDSTPTSEGYTRDVGQSAPLTNREREILALLADGLGNKQIAARLGVSPNTVKTHLELLFDKIGVRSRAEAVAVGVKRGMLLL